MDECAAVKEVEQIAEDFLKWRKSFSFVRDALTFTFRAGEEIAGRGDS